MSRRGPTDSLPRVARRIELAREVFAVDPALAAHGGVSDRGGADAFAAIRGAQSYSGLVAKAEWLHDQTRPHGMSKAQYEECLRTLEASVSPIDTPAAADAALAGLERAAEEFRALDQEQTDEIFRQVALEVNRQRVLLAALAVADTGMGLLEDKTVKNHFASEYVFAKHKDTPTVGVVARDPATGVMDIAEPLGPIAGLIPCTNPTSTAIFKGLIALKTRNPIIFMPHPRSHRATHFTAELLRKTAVRFGAPEDCIRCVRPSKEMSDHIMRHDAVKLILATGGNAMVKAAYASGHPAIGVGAGNAPSIVDETADVDRAAGFIVTGKTFDNGVICASEQAVVAVDAVYDDLYAALARRGVHFLDDSAKAQLEAVFWKDGHLNPDVVGQSAARIAAMAGIDIPPSTLVLGVVEDQVGPNAPFSHEKLSPVLAVYRAADFAAALDLGVRLAENGGLGHTAALHTAPDNEAHILEFSRRMPTCHNLVNMPSSLGAIGSGYNPNLEPSLTLGVGSYGSSSTSLNVGPSSLLNIKRTAALTQHIEWFKVPPAVYFNAGALREAFGDLFKATKDGGRLKRCMVVTDRFIEDMGQLEVLKVALREHGVAFELFLDVEPDPSLDTVRKGVAAMRRFEPDVVVAWGGGSPMDAAKVMRLMYEHPEMTLEDMAVRFIEIRHRAVEFPAAGTKVQKLVAVPTTSGTGAEMTPFAVITGDDGRKYPICSYRMTPEIAIVDPDLVRTLPAPLAAATGMDALSHAVESLVSCYQSDYTKPLSLQATKMIMESLPASVESGDYVSRQKVHHGAAIAGLAFGSAFLGVCHSLAHQLGAKFHIPHGIAIAMLLPHVIAFNADNAPTRQAYFPQLTHPVAEREYAGLADYIGVTAPDMTPTQRVGALIGAVEGLKAQIGMPKSIRAYGVTKEEFAKMVDEMALNAFDDQCTGTNPRWPLVTQLHQVLWDAYEGQVRFPGFPAAAPAGDEPSAGSNDGAA